MSLFKQNKLRILGASIILILLLLPGITLAEHALNIVIQKMAATETIEPTEKPQELGEPIIADSAADIEQRLNDANLSLSNDSIQEQELYGNRLVFIDSNTQELKSFNLKTRETINISKSTNYKEQLAIFKNKAIWTELNEIWAYDFKDSSMKKISNQQGDLSDIYGDLVVYRGLEQPGIYLYNFKTEKTETITQMPNGIYSVPSIWKDIIAWADESDGYLNAYYHDIKQNKTTKITNFSEERYVGYPTATENSIIYPFVDDNENKLLMEYDIKKGETKALQDLNKGIFKVTVDKFNGGRVSYRHTNHETVIVDLENKELKVHPTVENKAVYGGVIIGTETNAPKFKVQRNH